MDAKVFDSLADLFDDKKGIDQLRIPPYQRTYSWTQEQWEALWEDLVTAMDSGQEHLLGMILIVPTSKDKRSELECDISMKFRYSQALVVDGQQRITTLILLAKAIENQLTKDIAVLEMNKGDVHVVLRKALLGLIRDFLYNKKIKASGVNKLRLSLSDASDKKDFESEFPEICQGLSSPRKGARIHKALNFFTGKILTTVGRVGTDSEAYIDKQDHMWEDLVNSLLFRLKIIVVSLDENEAGDIAFHRINQGGKKLSAMDLTRNLIYTKEREANAKALNLERPSKHISFESVLQKYEDNTLSRGLRLYLQFYKGAMRVSEKHFYKCLVELMDNSDVQPLPELEKILELVRKSDVHSQSLERFNVIEQAFELLLKARGLLLTEELDLILRQLRVLLYGINCDQLLESRDFFNTYFKLTSSVLQGKVLLSKNALCGLSYASDVEEDPIRLPNYFGNIVSENSLEACKEAHLKLTAIEGFSVAEEQACKAIRLVSWEDTVASDSMAYATWKDFKEMLPEQATIHLSKLSNYILVPLDSTATSASTWEEKLLESQKLGIIKPFSAAGFTPESVKNYLDSYLLYLSARFKIMHYEALAYLDIANGM